MHVRRCLIFFLQLTPVALMELSAVNGPPIYVGSSVTVRWKRTRNDEASQNFAIVRVFQGMSGQPTKDTLSIAGNANTEGTVQFAGMAQGWVTFIAYILNPDGSLGIGMANLGRFEVNERPKSSVQPSKPSDSPDTPSSSDSENSHSKPPDPSPNPQPDPDPQSTSRPSFGKSSSTPTSPSPQAQETVGSQTVTKTVFSSTPISSPENQTSVPEQGRKTNVAVVGGAVGGVLALLLILTGAVFCVRRQRRQARALDSLQVVESYALPSTATSASFPFRRDKERVVTHQSWESPGTAGIVSTGPHRVRGTDGSVTSSDSLPYTAFEPVSPPWSLQDPPTYSAATQVNHSLQPLRPT